MTVASLKDKNDIKIFILYLMKKIDEPLDFNTLCDVVTQDEFVTYFECAECFAELLDMGAVERILMSDGGGEVKEYYKITRTGATVAEELQSNLLTQIKDKSLKSAMRLLSFKKEGSAVKFNQTPMADGKYRFDAEMTIKGTTVMKLSTVLEDSDMLRKVCNNFEERPETIYRGMISILTGDINYLID